MDCFDHIDHLVYDVKMGKTKTQEEAIAICESLGIDPEKLKQIWRYKCKNMNNAEVGEEVGLHRVSVQRILSKIEKLDQKSYSTIFQGLLIGEQK